MSMVPPHGSSSSPSIQMLLKQPETGEGPERPANEPEQRLPHPQSSGFTAINASRAAGASATAYEATPEPYSSGFTAINSGADAVEPQPKKRRLDVAPVVAGSSAGERRVAGLSDYGGNDKDFVQLLIDDGKNALSSEKKTLFMTLKAAAKRAGISEARAKDIKEELKPAIQQRIIEEAEEGVTGAREMYIVAVRRNLCEEFPEPWIREACGSHIVNEAKSIRYLLRTPSPDTNKIMDFLERTKLEGESNTDQFRRAYEESKAPGREKWDPLRLRKATGGLPRPTAKKIMDQVDNKTSEQQHVSQEPADQVPLGAVTEVNAAAEQRQGVFPERGDEVPLGF